MKLSLILSAQTVSGRLGHSVTFCQVCPFGATICETSTWYAKAISFSTLQGHSGEVFQLEGINLVLYTEIHI